MRGRILYRHDGTRQYVLNGEEVSQEVFEKSWPSKEVGMPYAAPIQDWAAENGGRGREISQLRADPTAPRVFARSPSHAMELAKSKGYDRAERT